MEAIIRGIGSYAPERRVTNDELAQTLDTSDEWIRSHTGIRSRHVAAPEEAASDLAVKAATRALSEAGCDPESVDLILLATSTPDYQGLPSTASVVQHRLGCKNAGAMDLVVACSGFVYGLETARAYIRGGMSNNILVIGSEVYSRIVDWSDRSTCILFGDGAGACLLSSSDGPAGVIDSVLRSRGSDAESLYRPVGGSRSPLAKGETPGPDSYLQMDGRKVYVFAVSVLVDIIRTLLERNNISIEEVDFIVPHQANMRIIEAAAKRAGIPMEKFFTNLQEYANTSAASIPIALDQMRRDGLLNTGALILTIGFGAGLAYGGNLIRL
ncbi:MAG: beta-ketoacyl-ACP synthase III [Spirochaetales bacterium]